MEGSEFCSCISSVYNEVIHWRRNMFKVPSGRVGDSFVKELARLFQAYADSSSLEPIALYSALVMSVLLQKPPGKIAAKDLTKHLERHLTRWSDGDIQSLVNEGRTIQTRLKSNHSNRSSVNLACRFSDLMFLGNTKAALRLLSDNENGNIDECSVKDILLDKHPPGQPVRPHALVSNPSPSVTKPFDPILFDAITPDLIRATALRTSGSSGPSGLDAMYWRRLCTSFKTSNDLCLALSSFAHRLCTSYVDPRGLSPFLASCLIAIDKLPGVCPIGIGEVVRRIIGKAILMVVGQDVMDVTGTDQLCAGQPGGCEAGVHAVHAMFQSMDCEAVLLVDASNAFNSLNRRTALLNRRTALLNILHLCPSIATILINCYRFNVQLFIDNDSLSSEEGTTQGDPLAMAMYALGVLPLIRDLKVFSV